MSMGVELRGVTKRFGRNAALDSVGVALAAGRVHAVLGPNGSGKTTFLRVAAGLEVPDTGEVVYTGRDGGPLQAGLGLMRRMTLVSQRPVMFAATVYRNIAYGLSVRGAGGEEADEMVRAAARLFGVEPMLKEHAQRLSGGEAQRVALARAWVLRPELLLLDEPSTSLDPDGGRLMEEVVLRMNREMGTTVIISTHNLFQARRVSDDAAFMYGGRLVEHGGSGEFFAGPREELARRFVSGDIVF